MAFESQYIWMDGELVEYEKATIPFLTPALHYGYAVFEGIRCYAAQQGPAIFRLREHTQRLLNSAELLWFRKLPYSLDELSQAAKEVVQANGFTACYIRPLIYLTRSIGNLSLRAGEPKIGIAAWDWPKYLSGDHQKGIRLNTSSFTRHHHNIMLTKAKASGNYVNSGLAKTESEMLGFDEAVMLDPQGYVAECTGENLFLVRRGKIYTPPAAAILEGITRDSIITLAADLGFPVFEQPISRDQLYIADELFLSGTAAEVVPVTEVDHHLIGEGTTGPITQSLRETFNKIIAGHHPRSQEWLEWV